MKSGGYWLKTLLQGENIEIEHALEVDAAARLSAA